jgi:hypothetical protein
MHKLAAAARLAPYLARSIVRRLHGGLSLAHGFTDTLIAGSTLVAARSNQVYAGGRPVQVTGSNSPTPGRGALER